VSRITKEDLARLSELLKAELEAYEQIRKLSKKQSALLAKDSISEFDESLDEGQKYIEKINGLHQESGPLMQSYMSAAEDSAATAVITAAADGKDAGIESLIAQIRDVLKACAELNAMNTDAAKEKTEGYTEKIGKLSANRKGIGGYAQSLPNTPEIFDKRS